MIKLFSIAVMLLLSCSLLAQDANVIKAEVRKKGNQDITTMNYYTLADLVRLPSLDKGKHRFYITADETCKLSLVGDKGAKITTAETEHFNEVLSRHKLEYYYENVRVTDCKQLGGRIFPITIIKE
ncbi:MAG TPA: hypothetical protein VGB50_00470 [Flavobacterium sp.]|jgi:hypothetical protein